LGAIEFFASHPVFTHEEFVASRMVVAGRSRRTADSLLRQHGLRGRIKHVRRGLYATVPPGVDPARFEPDAYLLISKVAHDAIVSHHAALQFHGRVYSIWHRYTFLTLRNMRRFRVGSAEFVPLKPPRAVAGLADMGGGFERVAHAGGTIRVSSRARTLVDLMDSPQHGGGWEEIWRSLQMVEFFDLELVVSYTLALNSALTAAKVGYFLEQHRDLLFVEDRHLDTLEKHAPKQARYFDSARGPGTLVRRWQLIVPEQVLHQTWAEVG
jgi:predicted transcriptional regulator of viral defense system